MSETPPPPPSRHLASHVFNLVVLVVGGIALAVMIRGLDWDKTCDLVASGAGWFALVMVLDLAGMSCDAAAIHAFMRPEARMVSYLHVFAAQASGRAINLVTPGGALGEATKVTMLATHAPHARAVSSIVLFNLAGLYLSVTIVLVGVPLTALMVDLPHQLQVVVWTAIGIVIALVVGLGFLVHRGALETALGAAVRLHLVSPARREAWRGKLHEIDGHLGELVRNRTAGTRIGMAFVGASQVCAWSATLAVLHAVGVPLSLHLVVGMFSVGVVIGWVSSIVPLGLGIADGSTYALFGVLGATPASGLVVTMVNRARSLGIALLGLTIMAVGHAANRVSLARRHGRHAASLAAAGGGATGDDRERLVVGPDRE